MQVVYMMQVVDISGNETVKRRCGITRDGLMGIFVGRGGSANRAGRRAAPLLAGDAAGAAEPSLRKSPGTLGYVTGGCSSGCAGRPRHRTNRRNSVGSRSGSLALMPSSSRGQHGVLPARFHAFRSGAGDVGLKEPARRAVLQIEHGKAVGEADAGARGVAVRSSIAPGTGSTS